MWDCVSFGVDSLIFRDTKTHGDSIRNDGDCVVLFYVTNNHEHKTEDIREWLLWFVYYFCIVNNDKQDKAFESCFFFFLQDEHRRLDVANVKIYAILALSTDWMLPESYANRKLLPL